jgi:hypothetical protein
MDSLKARNWREELLALTPEQQKRLNELRAQIADDLSIPEFMKRVIPAVQPDMYRVRRSDGSTSDMVNLTRAREVARFEFRRDQAQDVEKEIGSGDSSSSEGKRGDGGDTPREVSPSSSAARSGRTGSSETDRKPQRPRLRKHPTK